MLILDIKNPVVMAKKSFFRRKQVTEQGIERNNFKYNKKIHTIVSVPENMLESEEFLKLLKMFEGQILVCNDERINALVEPYRFNPLPYFKDAVYSSLYNIIKTDQSIKTVCIKDSAFKSSEALFDIVKISKNTIIETEPTIETQRFCDECYYNFGAFVRITRFHINRDNGLFINTEDIDREGKGVVSIDGKEAIIYPDPKYFNCDNQLKELLKYKIPIKTLCAGFMYD